MKLIAYFYSLNVPNMVKPNIHCKVYNLIKLHKNVIKLGTHEVSWSSNYNEFDTPVLQWSDW